MASAEDTLSDPLIRPYKSAVSEVTESLRDGDFQFRFYLSDSFWDGSASISAREHFAESQSGSNQLIIPAPAFATRSHPLSSKLGISFQPVNEEHRVPIRCDSQIFQGIFPRSIEVGAFMRR